VLLAVIRRALEALLRATMEAMNMNLPRRIFFFEERGDPRARPLARSGGQVSG